MFLASRYCAKEAFAKAMGTGVGKAFSFQDLQVMNDEAGKPVLQYSEKLGSWMRANRFTALLSLSDETHYVMATVIFEQQDY